MEEYRGLKIYEGKNYIDIEGIKDFNLVHTFTCGQCFRWLEQPDGSFSGVAEGRAVNMALKDGVLRINNSNVQDFKNIWFEYLDLGRDYGIIKDKLKEDEIMAKAIKYGYGIRILKQNFYETLISFIISSNNAIPRIMKTVEAISQSYGDKVFMNGETYYAFPRIDKLAAAALEELWVCKGGFRCRYIISSASMINSGEIREKMLYSLTTDEARKELMTLPGVGPKVADCILLYSGIKHDVFPTDVWVKRVMEELYFKREASFKEIQQFAADKFGENTGIAQQYLFYYARGEKIGTKK